jgi:WD40 repeat protein
MDEEEDQLVEPLDVFDFDGHKPPIVSSSHVGASFFCFGTNKLACVRYNEHQLNLSNTVPVAYSTDIVTCSLVHIYAGRALVLAGLDDGRIAVYDATTLELIQYFKKHGASISCITPVSPTGKDARVISTAVDFTILVWTPVREDGGSDTMLFATESCSLGNPSLPITLISDGVDIYGGFQDGTVCAWGVDEDNWVSISFSISSSRSLPACVMCDPQLTLTPIPPSLQFLSFFSFLLLYKADEGTDANSAGRGCPSCNLSGSRQHTLRRVAEAGSCGPQHGRAGALEPLSWPPGGIPRWPTGG